MKQKSHNKIFVRTTPLFELIYGFLTVVKQAISDKAAKKEAVH